MVMLLTQQTRELYTCSLKLKTSLLRRACSPSSVARLGGMTKSLAAAPEFLDKPHIAKRDEGKVVVIKIRCRSKLDCTGEWFKNDNALKTTDRIKTSFKKDESEENCYQFALEIHVRRTTTVHYIHTSIRRLVVVVLLGSERFRDQKRATKRSTVAW